MRSRKLHEMTKGCHRKAHHIKLNRTEIGATVQLTPSDLKNRPRNRGRAPYVCSKNNPTLQRLTSDIKNRPLQSGCAPYIDSKTSTFCQDIRSPAPRITRPSSVEHSSTQMSKKKVTKSTSRTGQRLGPAATLKIVP